MTESTLVEEFRAQSVAENIAVRSHDRSLTYARLDQESDALARTLRAKGVGPETAVALLVETSVDYVVAVLAVVKAGGYYVPVRASDPPARTAAMLSALDALVMLTDRANLAQAQESGIAVVLVDDRAEEVGSRTASPEPSVESLAYVIHTSGSTGTPKAVGATHRAVKEFARSRAWRTRGRRRVLLHSPHAFDASTYELWVPLLNGWEIVVPDQPFYGMDPAAFERAITGHGVTDVFLTAALFAAFAEIRPDCLAGAQEVWFGGEAASAPAVRRVVEHCPNLRLVNVYGPTETTTFATFHPIPTDEPVPDRVPIGEAMPEMGALVLDGKLSPTPEGETGELYLSGAGLSRGYLGNAAATAERFVADPSGPPGTRMYRTGDLVRRGPAGLEFLGRVDGMVKLRGFRIELGEIDTALTGCADIAQVATVVRTNPVGTEQLVAFARPTGDHIDRAAVRARLADTLPDYMLPSQIVEVDALPLNPNGKIDRAALESRDLDGETAVPEAIPPTEAGREITAIWEEVLGRTNAGMNDSFFEAGGDSIRAMMVVHRLRQRHDVSLSVRAILEAGTLGGLHALVEAAPDPARATRPLPPDPHAEPVLTVGQHGMLLYSRFSSGDNLYTVPFVLDVPHRLDPEALQAALVDVVQRHEPLRTVYPMDSEGTFRLVVRAPEVPFQTRAVAADAVEDNIGRAVRTGFDLAGEPPLRATLFDVDGRRSVLLLLIHHIACDGTSIVPLFDDLAVAYQARRTGTAGLRPTRWRFNDFARWEQAAMADPDGTFADQLDFWRRSLDGLPAELPLPVDRPRPARPSYRSGVVSTTWPPAVHRAVTELGHQENSGLFAILQAGLAAVLTDLCGETDIPIGTVTAHRPDAAWADLVGFFANTLVLRVDSSGKPTFRELVRRTRATVLDALDHQDVLFSRVVEAVNPPRRYGRHPLFQVAAALRDAEWSSVGFDGARADVRVGSAGATMFDLKFEFTVTHGDRAALGCVLEYSEEIFDASTASRILDRLRAFLSDAVRRPDDEIGTISRQDRS